MSVAPSQAAAFTELSVRRSVAILAVPVIAENLLVTSVQMLDMIMVGRLGPAAITAVGLGNRPIFFALAAFMSLNVGATALVARLTGAGERGEASEAARQALILILGLAVVVAGVGLATGHHVISLMGAGPDVKDAATAYFRIVISGIVFTGVSMGMSACLRGAGDTRTPLKVNAVANVVNVLGNYCLIFGHLGLPALGVSGAAVATVVARAIACALVLGVLLRRKSRVSVSLRGIHLRPDLIRRILKVGLPASGEQFILRGGQVVYARAVAALGTLAYASHQIALTVEGLSFMPAMGFAAAATTLVGQNLGAGKPDRAERAALETLRLGLLVMGAAGCIFFFGAGGLVGLYTDHPDVHAGGVLCLRLIALAQPALATHFILAGALRGAGDTRFTMVSTTVGIWVFRVGLAYLLALTLGLGLLGAWLAMAADICARAVLIYARFRRSAWKELQV